MQYFFGAVLRSLNYNACNIWEHKAQLHRDTTCKRVAGLNGCSEAKVTYMSMRFRSFKHEFCICFSECGCCKHLSLENLNSVVFLLQMWVQLLNSLGLCLCCSTLHFVMHHTFFSRGWGVIWTAGGAPFFLHSHIVVRPPESILTLFCWIKLEKTSWQHMLSHMYLSASMVQSQVCKLPMPRALTHSHTVTYGLYMHICYWADTLFEFIWGEASPIVIYGFAWWSLNFHL